MAQQSIGAASRIGRLGVFLLLLGAPTLTWSATIVVPVDRPTIQAAVDAAAPGDTILVRPGTYAEHVRIAGARNGLTLAGSDEHAPPVIVADDRPARPAIRIDGADDVTIGNVVVQGGSEGVRVDVAYGVLLTGLRIESAGVGIHIRRGGHDAIVDSNVIGTRTAQGIRVEASPALVIRGVTVDGSRRDAILVRRSRGATITDTTVSNTHARHGITVVGSAGLRIVNCTARRNRGDGIHVRGSAGLELRRNDADDNGVIGVHLDRCSPYPSIGDVVAAGNDASANARRDIVVTHPRCRRLACRTTTTTSHTTTTQTTTSRPPASTPAVTTTSTTVVHPTFTPTTTTAATPTTHPVPLVRWRLYVRITLESTGPHDVDVPFRSTDDAIAIDIPANVARGFRVGDQVTAVEIAALGGDTLHRFEGAADAYIVAHPASYAGFVALDSVRWVMRVSE